MTKISGIRSKVTAYSPRNVQGQIDALKMRIAQIELAVQNGYLKPEEAKAMIDNLMAQIDSLEAEQTTKDEPNAPIEPTAGNEITNLNFDNSINTDDKNADNNQDNNDDDSLKNQENYFDAQANYNRVFHCL